MNIETGPSFPFLFLTPKRPLSKQGKPLFGEDIQIFEAASFAEAANLVKEIS